MRPSGNIKCSCIDGWLDREGRIYLCKFNHHLSAACKLEKELGLEESLEYLGWVKIHSAGVYFFRANEYCDRLFVKITESQRKWLVDNGYRRLK